ncbi:hypothetical protein PENTCL1PPCAC_7864, partial [Pristionchus entomophagus]
TRTILEMLLFHSRPLSLGTSIVSSVAVKEVPQSVEIPTSPLPTPIGALMRQATPFKTTMDVNVRKPEIMVDALGGWEAMEEFVAGIESLGKAQMAIYSQLSDLALAEIERKREEKKREEKKKKEMEESRKKEEDVEDAEEKENKV